MAERAPYSLIYAPNVSEHLKAIDRKYQTLIEQKIEEQLLFAPMVESNNRKRLRQPAPFDADWEIRFGRGNRFRVFYEVDEERREVFVLAIGEKDRNKLRVGGEEIEL